MTVNIDDLGTVWEALFDIRSKAYNIGLKLQVSVATLDKIMRAYCDPSDQLREVLKVWLKAKKWQTIVEVLRSPTIGEPVLAGDIEAEYCQGTQGQASGQATPVSTLTWQELERELQELYLVEKEAVTKLAQESDRLRKEVLAIQRKLMQASIQPQPNSLQQQMTRRKLTWRTYPKAPERLYRGSVATDGTMVYFNGEGSARVYQFQIDSLQWSELPNLPLIRSTLVVVQNKLTSVGGIMRFGEVTNLLLSLTAGKWVAHLPPMVTKRWSTAVVCKYHSLITAGGFDGHNTLTAVEVLDIDTLMWSTASSLPHPLSDVVTSICGDKLYLLGGMDMKSSTHSVLTCSIPELLDSCHGQTQLLATKPLSIWRSVADAPYKASSCATLCGQLIAVGGRDEVGKETAAVFAFDETSDCWIAMEPMTTPRHWALVVSIHDNMIMVVGGRKLDTAEIAKVQ